MRKGARPTSDVSEAQCKWSPPHQPRAVKPAELLHQAGSINQERQQTCGANFRKLTETGNIYPLTNHLGNPDAIIVSGGRLVIAGPGAPAD